MSRTHFRHIYLRRWFPPHDPIAVTIARLCILREDLLLEGQAIRQAEIKPLDTNGEFSRRLYFWRNSFRTLDSIKSAVHNLKCQKPFRDAGGPSIRYCGMFAPGLYSFTDFVD